MRAAGAWLGGPSARPFGIGQRMTFAAAVVVMNVVDVITTHSILGDGGTELNPVAGRLLAAGALTEVKIGLSLAVAALVLIAPMRRHTERVLWGVLVFYSVLLTFHLAQLAGIRFA